MCYFHLANYFNSLFSHKEDTLLLMTKTTKHTICYKFELRQLDQEITVLCNFYKKIGS